MIKVITFDLDGVYFIKGKEKFIKSLIGMGVADSEARRVFFDSEEMKKYKRGEWSDEQFWTWATDEWKINKTMPELVKILIDGYEENSEVVATVTKVRANGYKTAVCSNNFPARINGLQERFKFLDNFDIAVMAYDVGALKPDKKILQALIDKSEVKPAEIFFADDREVTVNTAKDMGIEAHFYTDFSNFIAELKSLRVRI